MRTAIIALASLLAIGTMAYGGAFDGGVLEIAGDAEAAHPVKCYRWLGGYICFLCPFFPTCIHLDDIPLS
jgi:hypothetical protein